MGRCEIQPSAQPNALQARLLQTVLDSLSDGLAAIDETGKFIQFNPAGERILGRGALDEPTGAWAERYGLFHADEQTPLAEHELPLVRALGGERVRDAELYVRNDRVPNGCWLKVSAAPMCDETGRVCGAVALFRDESDRRRAEQALETERGYLRHLIRMQDRDRRLTAYDLHDGVVQLMTGAMLRLEAYRGRHRASPSAADDDLVAAMAALREGLDEARRLIGGLRPPVLDREGILGAIRYLLRSLSEREQLDVEFTHDVRFDRMQPLLETTVFRIVQEALHNVVRHAETRRARVRLEQRGGELSLEIRDWGKGFDPANRKEHRYGLRGIQERAAALGGEATVESGAGVGTTIRVTLPVLLPGATHQHESIEP